jgi:hypothetical protein
MTVKDIRLEYVGHVMRRGGGGGEGRVCIILVGETIWKNLCLDGRLRMWFRITKGWDLKDYVVRIRGGWNWFRIVAKDWFWYYLCCAFMRWYLSVIVLNITTSSLLDLEAGMIRYRLLQK